MRCGTLLLAAIAGCVSAEPGDDPSFRERLLATVSSEARVDVPVVHSADGRRAAWVERRGDTSRAVSGSWRSEPFGTLC